MPRRDTDGFADIRSYAAIGDGRTVALVSLDGSIDWYPTPDLDSTPAFARLLDADEGFMSLAPTGAFSVERRYADGTNVLETTYTTATGTVRVTDSLNTGVAGRLPWGELARRIDGLTGSVDMAWSITPGTCFGSASPWLDNGPDDPVLRIDAVGLGIRGLNHGLRTPQGPSVEGAFTTSAGSRHLVAVISTHGEPLPLQDPQTIDDGVDRTIRNWQSWSDNFAYDGDYRHAVLRSALTLKLLLHSPSGSIAAAATTSLPESAAGGKNWDYRYAWVRDTAYTLHSLTRAGLREEVHAAVSWMLKNLRTQGSDLEVFTRLNGEIPEGTSRPDLTGWRNNGPVVNGNPAAGQLQLGVFGDVFDIVWQYVQAGHVLDPATMRQLADLADLTCDIWRRRDAGMWELPEERHYVTSKLGCWNALRCAVLLAERSQLQGPVERWAAERDRIRDWVHEHGWSEERQSYIWYPGSTELDASILLHAMSGFDTGPRMSSTIDALREELGAGPLLYRYSGMQEEEASFVACAYWMVSALVAVGRRDEAVDLMEALLPLANDVGIMSEMIEPSDSSFMGNIPQGLSHLALIVAALSISGKA
ncbi:glycoside hydrolase family 15 protein [Arthrobacter sp. NPDC092385]|uniref:glycoside hydrolase family 15 protein n=1 Tax=Arthrobacter sp. NPDC092385 TaxID=3363943 RepID=UPI0038206448